MQKQTKYKRKIYKSLFERNSWYIQKVSTREKGDIVGRIFLLIHTLDMQ